MVPIVHLKDVKLGDSIMSYVQYVIQAGNIELFKEILVTNEGIEDFLESLDIHGNTCLHYIALLDQEDFIDVVFSHIG